MRIYTRMLGTDDGQWANPALPCCILCGTRIECDENARDFFSQVPGLEPNSVRYKILPEGELHSMLAEGKCQWKSAYRAIVKPLDGPPIISGASYRHRSFGVRGGYTMAVPRRQDTVILAKGIIHPRGEFLWFKEPEQDPSLVEGAQIGWPIHESCWMMADKCFRREFIENNIELFMHALDEEHRRKRADRGINGPIDRESGNWGFLQRDPMYIPELRQLAQMGLEKYQSSTVAQMNQSTYKGAMTASAFRISPGSFSRLPLDIAMEIAGYLSGPDLRRLIIAAQWKFPSIYWKRRIPAVIFELYEVLARRDIDWQHVGLEYDRLMERTNGIHHRLRLADYLSRIHASCHNNLGEVFLEEGQFITYVDL
ncbi:hypothetical protein UA08_02243 [Talaromyces atroroseus]|uniref:F-box domain-containing protein n=1 Tax=Talaromyces atroroseus TaxID=1441469 RepID=A0A225AMJ1_TALAT|nr:hypothetical protein UA08_02243 [Talaromyces atroroseus]OKL62110.1 hypothetical protein UA08_02243 [Talaromyces atroroseus]